MPQLLLLGLAAAGGWYAWKTLKREMARIDDELERERKAAARPQDTLERDPATGKYRPRQGKLDGNP
jgi:hypothetical protein